MFLQKLFGIFNRNELSDKKDIAVKKEPLLSVPKGSYIICSNFHVVAITNRDIHKYDTGYASAFDYLEHQPVPIKGQMQDPTCYCGAAWFRNQGSKLVMKPVLMEKENENYKTESIRNE